MVFKFILDEFQKIKVIIIKFQGINYVLLYKFFGLFRYLYKLFFLGFRGGCGSYGVKCGKMQKDKDEKGNVIVFMGLDDFGAFLSWMYLSWVGFQVGEFLQSDSLVGQVVSIWYVVYFVICYSGGVVVQDRGVCFLIFQFV